MTYAEAFRYDARTVVVRTRERGADTYTARDIHTGAVGEGASATAAVRRLRGGR